MTCRCAPALVALRGEINARWPGRDKASDGCCGDAAHAARRSDHNPDGSGYAHALDIDEDILTGVGDRPLWDRLRPALLADDRTKYVIYEARIMYPDGTNKPYTGINAHKHHLHLSIKATATHDTRRWLPPLLPEDVLMREERIIVVPAPIDGRQLVGYDKSGQSLGKWSATSSVQVCASAQGDLTPLLVQPTKYGDELVLAVARLDGTPAPQGAEARVLIEHR